MDEKGDWILRASNTYRGRPLYFAQMTSIGPMTTAKKAEAARFATREAAVSSPATRFWLMTFTAERA